MPSITIISDTHGQHKGLQLPPGDFLIHTGDFSRRGMSDEIKKFLKWFVQQPFPNKILIAGNHDFMAEKEPGRFRALLPENIIYLENEPCETAGIKIWGSPITPWFYDWAFNRRRGPEIKKYWDEIPLDTDILLTHGPPKGYNDATTGGDHVGCEDLLNKVLEVKPAYHIYGHIHEAYGQSQNTHTRFINASVLDVRYNLVNDPVTIQYKLPDAL